MATRFSKKLLQSFFAEMMCSFIFGYVVYSTSLTGNYLADTPMSIYTGMAIAFSGVALIYTFADHTISHFNPAITLAAMLTLHLDFINGLGFIIMQLIGFMLAALLAVATFPGDYMDIMGAIRVSRPDNGTTNVNIFFSEFTLTAILTFVAFMVGINSYRNPECSLYGDEELPDRTLLAPLTIGYTLGFLAFMASNTSGGAFNPGLVFAPMMLSMKWPLAWQFYVSEFTGGLLGGLIQTWILFK